MRYRPTASTSANSPVHQLSQSFAPQPSAEPGAKRERSGTHHVIAHRDKKIKEQLPAPLHLHLHRPAPLESAPTPDDQRQIMRPQLRIAVRRVRVREPRTRQYRRALDPAL